MQYPILAGGPKASQDIFVSLCLSLHPVLSFVYGAVILLGKGGGGGGGGAR